MLTRWRRTSWRLSPGSSRSVVAGERLCLEMQCLGQQIRCLLGACWCRFGGWLEAGEEQTPHRASQSLRLHPKALGFFLLHASGSAQPRLSQLWQHSPVPPTAPRLTHRAPGREGAGAGGHQGSSVVAAWRIQSLCAGQGKCCEVCVVQAGFFLCLPGLQDSSNHQKNKAFEFQTENARNLKEAETLLKDLFLDVDRAKRLRHPQAPEIEKE